MITVRRTFWVMLALAAGAVLGITQSSRPDIFSRLLYFSGLLIAVCWLWTFFSLRGLSVQRQARVARQQVGQIFEERFLVNNSSAWLRLWVKVEDRSDLPGASGSRVLGLLGGRQQRSYSAYSWLNRRGSFNLGPTELSSGDPLGLFVARTIFLADSPLVVLPYMVELKSFPMPAGVLPGGRALRRRTVEVTPYAASVREYAPGDGLNRIHWPTTARRNRLMVKEFDQDPQADVWIFVDAQQSVQLSLDGEVATPRVDQLLIWRQKLEVSLTADTFEYAVSVAASVANYFIRLGRAVGLVCAGQVTTVVPAERGERQLAKILEILAFVRGKGDLSLLGLVEVEAPVLARGSTVVLVTPSCDRGVEMTADALQQRNLNPVAVLLDRTTFGGAPSPLETALHLRARNIPTAMVKNGANLAAVLEEGF